MEEELIKFLWFVFSDLLTAALGCVVLYLVKKRRITPYEAKQLMEHKAEIKQKAYDRYVAKVVKRCPELKEVTTHEEKKNDA